MGAMPTPYGAAPAGAPNPYQMPPKKPPATYDGAMGTDSSQNPTPNIDPSTGQPWAPFTGISEEAAAALPGQISQGFSGMAQEIAGDRAAGFGDPNNSSANPQQVAAQHATDSAAADAASAGPLSGPGPLEQWSAANSGAYDSPSAAESLYKEHGNDLVNTKSYAETLYDQGSGQMDPYYDYAQKKSERAINDAAAARGGWNSSNATNNIRDSAANLYGQQAMQMGARATAADNSRLGRYAATEGMAGDSDSGYNTRVSGAENLYGGWQKAQEDRLGGAQSSATQLAQGQANVVSNAYKNAGDLSNQDNLEAFNAQLQKLGIDPKSSAVQDFIKTLGAAGSVATALA